MERLVELSLAALLLYCAILLIPWEIPQSRLLRMALMVLSVLVMETLPPRPLQTIAAVGAVAVAYAFVSKA